MVVRLMSVGIFSVGVAIGFEVVCALATKGAPLSKANVIAANPTQHFMVGLPLFSCR